MSSPRFRIKSVNANTAFSLSELLLVVALIALLGGLIMPVTARLREQMKTTDCVAKLRWIGNAILVGASEQNGWVVTRGGNRWFTYHPAIVNAIKQPSQAWASANFKKIACDVGPPPTIDHVYGLRLNTQTSDGLAKRVDVNYSGTLISEWSDRILLRSIPAGYPFLGDTADSSGRQAQYFSTSSTDPGWARVGLRHQGRANLWFPDGHIESCSRDRLRALGVSYIRDQNGAEEKL